MRHAILLVSAVICVGCSNRSGYNSIDTARSGTATMAGAPSTARDSAVERQAIDQVQQRELASLSDSSVALSSVFSTDIVAMPPNDNAVIGLDHVEAWFKQMQREYAVAGRYPESTITLAGDWAIERYAGELTMTPRKGGKPIQDRFKGIHIYHRQPDGSWRITDDIWNSNAPPVAPAKSR